MKKICGEALMKAVRNIFIYNQQKRNICPQKWVTT